MSHITSKQTHRLKVKRWWGGAGIHINNSQKNRGGYSNIKQNIH